eukprot:jgi/Chrzof1/9616/Cz04g09240.t1
MLRTAAKRASQGQDVAAALLTQTRQYVGSLSVEFTDNVASTSRGAKVGPNILADWSNTKAATEHSLKLLQTYKEIGETEKEPYLQHHNPRTFEDLTKPVPNFKKFNLKPGQVPKFFDGVLQKRVGDALAVKGDWWESRKKAAEAAAADKSLKDFPTLPVPKWQVGKPVALEELKSVTDAYIKSMEPIRKLKVPEMPAQVQTSLKELARQMGNEKAVMELQNTLAEKLKENAIVLENGKPVPGFEYLTEAEAQTALNIRRSAIHKRYVSLWAQRILTMPEQALVPLKERDHLLASKFEDVSDKYDKLIELVARGPVPYGERLASCAAMDNFLLRRDKQKVLEQFPPSNEEQEAVALAKQLDDAGYALDKLLGPTMLPEGAPNRLKSDEVEQITEQLHTPDRYLYQEGKKLAARYKEEEKELAEQLKQLYGSDADLISVQRNPKTPLQRIAEYQREAAGRLKQIEELKAKYADNAYMQYALTNQAEFFSDPSNVAFEEILYPELVRERFETEWADLNDKEWQLDEAEEEEMWLLRLQQQSRHIHQNLEFDLPQSAYAHMDPILYKKIDWETTQGLDLLHHIAHQGAESEAGQYFKDQYGLENLSHHMLPLLRYRRKKYRMLEGYYAPELTAVHAKTLPAK